MLLRVTDDEAFFKKHGMEDCEAFTEYTPGSTTVLIVLRPGVSAGIIAHEALHAAKFILERAGLRFSSATEESYAYLLDWLVEWLTKKTLPHAPRKAA